MKKLYLLLILTILTGITQSHAFDTLHNYNHHNQEEQSSGWYDTIKSFFGQKVPDVQGRDLIIINNDRTINFNEHKLKMGGSTKEWIKVLGEPSRETPYGGLIWDKKGILIATSKNNKAEEISIQFLTYYEIFPDHKLLNRKYENGSTPEGYFKGVIKIEDGYMAREVTRKEFKRSKVWRKLRKDAFPNSYWMSYGHNEMYQTIVTTFTPNGKAKRISIN